MHISSSLVAHWDRKSTGDYSTENYEKNWEVLNEAFLKKAKPICIAYYVCTGMYCGKQSERKVRKLLNKTQKTA